MSDSPTTINITYSKEQLSPAASCIFGKFLDAIQDAEELGGVADTADYKNLMSLIVYAAHGRWEAAK